MHLLSYVFIASWFVTVRNENLIYEPGHEKTLTNWPYKNDLAKRFGNEKYFFFFIKIHNIFLL